MDLSEREALERIEARIAKEHFIGQWKFEPFQQAAKDGPPPLCGGFAWRWDDIEANLVELKHAIPESMNVRRNISFVPPGMSRGTTQSMVMGVQMIKPGERAWGHRHMADALRFVVKGDARLQTVVNGEACPMENFDLIRTPSMCWHDHFNGSDHDVAWVDIVDSPVIGALNQQFYEDYSDQRQPIRNQPPAMARGDLRPTWGEGGEPGIPSYRYRWSETEPRLKEMAGMAGSPCDGIALEYVNRETGGSTFTRMTCWAQMLRPGEETKSHRHTYSSVYFVIRGKGRTVIGDVEIDWKERDCFVVPSWAWHQHMNGAKSDEAMLFATHDKPLVEKLGTYHEEFRG